MINWIVTSSVLILVVAGLRFALRGKISARLQYTLWLVVLVRLLLPFELGASELSLLNAVEQIPVVQEMEHLKDAESISYHEEDGTVYKNRSWEEDSWSAVAENRTEAEFHQMEEQLELRDFTAAVWKLGVAVMAVLFLAVNFRFKRKLEADRRLLADAGTALPVYISDSVETPCLFGLLRPAIYVTPEAVDDETILRHAIEHEISHYLQKDHIWSFLRCAALCLHWYNPLVWWAVKLSKDDGELACDEAAIRRLGEEERHAYGKTLIEMTKPGRNALLGTATTMTGSKSSLKKRIERIAKQPKMAAYTLIAVLVIAAVAAVCTFTGAENREFEEWLGSVKDEDISYGQAYRGVGREQVSVVLKNDKKEELAAILNRLTEEQIYQEKNVDSSSDYKLFLAGSDSGDYESEYLFHVFEDGRVSVTFDSATAGQLEHRGKCWWIRSPELTAFVIDLVEEYGVPPILEGDMMSTDVDDDGQAEVFNVVEGYQEQVYVLQVSDEDGTLIWEEELGTAHVGWGALLLYQDGEKDYLMRWFPSEGQGYAGYSYAIFQVRDGQEMRLDEDSVTFELQSDETITSEVIDFLNKVNIYLADSRILLSTVDGEVIIGPTSAIKFINHNQQILNRENSTVNAEKEMDAAAAMGSVEAEDFVRLETMSEELREPMAMAMRIAADKEITEAEAIGAGYNPDAHAYYRTGRIYLEKSSDTWLSNNDLHFELKCGLTENIVQVTYGKSDQYDVAYFQDDTLYWFIRGLRNRNDRIDETEFQKYETVLTEKMEETLQMMKSNPGNFFDYELCRFYEILEFEEDGGSVVHLYDFDFALLTGTPHHIGWAGGMYLDANARLRGLNVGQFAVRLQDGVLQAYVFMYSDEQYNPEYHEEDQAFWREKISERLSTEGKSFTGV